MGEDFGIGYAMGQDSNGGGSGNIRSAYRLVPHFQKQDYGGRCKRRNKGMMKMQKKL